METLKWMFLLLLLYPGNANYNNESDINVEKRTTGNRLGDFLVSPRKQNWTRCGDNMCQCKGYQALCANHGHQLNYIPRFEQNITQLNFTANYLPLIDNETFTNITKMKINYLHLQLNSIQNCKRTAFNALKFLRTLHLREHTIPRLELMDCLSGLTKDLQFLYLSNYHYHHPLDLDLDSSMTNSNIIKLHLQDVNMIHYNQSKLSTLKRLRNITIYRSLIKTVTFNYSFALETLDFGTNRLHQLPTFCVQGHAYFPNLKYLCLDHNGINSIPLEQITCMKSLAIFSICNNQIRTIESNAFSKLPNLHILSLQYNGHGMAVHDFAFNSSSLKELYLEDDDIYFGGYYKHVSLSAFKYCKRLELLRLSSNDFSTVTNPIFEEIFSNLVNLKSLSLAHCGLRFLPSFIPIHLKKLETLWLARNNIIAIPEGYFSSLNSLQNVQLNSNKITTVKPFSLQFFRQLKSIDLSSNPFSCSCELLWFINFLKTSPIRKRFVHFPKQYTCVFPTVFKGKQLLQVRLSEHTCAVTKLVRVIIISISTGILLLLLTISVVYRYRWYLRYIIYMARFQHVRYQRLLNGGGNYKYDVYLSSCDVDFDDVIYDELVPRLEEGMGLRLYIPQRDGQGNKIDQIISNMDASRKVMLFISDKYVEDGYCEFEASFAYNKYINEKRDLMIAVVLGELRAKNVTKTIHKILAVDNYIKWGWDEESVELFWLKITTAINNLDDLIP